MGAEASKPRPGAKLQVIGAGLPRTGTASFSAALAILLDGPVYHGGTQIVVSDYRDETHIKAWTDIWSRTPFQTDEDRRYVMSHMTSLLDGYVGTADTPCAQFVPELMELYPDAKVICTVRDPDAWTDSMDRVSRSTLQSMLPTMVFWVPVVRWFTQYITAMQAGRWGELYAKPGETWSKGRDVWERHMEYLERTVPKDKLVFFDVRDGWGPLCAALDKPIPEGVAFPKVNDGAAIDRFAQDRVRNGLMRWAVVLASTAVAMGVVRTLWRR